MLRRARQAAADANGDVDLIVGASGVSRNRAFAALEKNDGDIDRALVELQPQAPRRDKGVGRKAGKRGGRR